MSLIPTLAETVSRARSDLRMGLPVMIGGHLVAAVETLAPARLADIRALGRPVLALTERRAETLKARAYDDGLARVCAAVAVLRRHRARAPAPARVRGPATAWIAACNVPLA